MIPKIVLTDLEGNKFEHSDVFVIDYRWNLVDKHTEIIKNSVDGKPNTIIKCKETPHEIKGLFLNYWKGFRQIKVKPLVKFRNGYPTKKAINALVEWFFEEQDSYKIHATRYVSSNTLWWSYEIINERIGAFCLFLKEYGIEAEIVSWCLNKSLRTGILRFKKKS